MDVLYYVQAFQGSVTVNLHCCVVHPGSAELQNQIPLCSLANGLPAPLGSLKLWSHLKGRVTCTF